MIDNTKPEQPTVAIQPVVGRTPSDAVTEIANSLFALLGRWTVPILFVGALAVAWYYQQEQSQRKDEAYNKALATLRQERDAAYLRISEFNKDVATVSSQQIKNLTEAFESLKRINQDAAERTQTVFDLEQKAADAAEALEDAQRNAAEALRESQAQLQRAQTNINEGQQRLEKNQALLRQSQQELERRVAEVEQKESDLTVRSGRIGELQDHLRELQDASEKFITAYRTLASELEETKPDEVLLSSYRLGLNDARGRYEIALGAARDMTVDVAKVLEPLSAFTSWGLKNNYADELVGLSQERFIEQLKANGGFGFDFWVKMKLETDSDWYLVGFAINPPLQFRLIIAELTNQIDAEARIVSTESYDVVLPVLGPAIENAWQNELAFLIVEPEDTDWNIVQWRGRTDIQSVSFEALFDGEVTYSELLVGEKIPQLPLITRKDFQGLLRSGVLPRSAERDLRPGGDNELSIIFDMIEERNTGAPNWSKAVSTISDPKLRAAVQRSIKSAVAGALDPKMARVSVDIKKEIGLSTELAGQESIQSAKLAINFGELAALALQPGFRVFVSDSHERCDEATAVQPTKSQNQSQSIESSCYPVTQIVASSDAGGTFELQFEDKLKNGSWKLMSLGAP